MIYSEIIENFNVYLDSFRNRFNTGVFLKRFDPIVEGPVSCSGLNCSGIEYKDFLSNEKAKINIGKETNYNFSIYSSGLSAELNLNSSVSLARDLNSEQALLFDNKYNYEYFEDCEKKSKILNYNYSIKNKFNRNETGLFFSGNDSDLNLHIGDNKKFQISKDNFVVDNKFYIRSGFEYFAESFFMDQKSILIGNFDKNKNNYYQYSLSALGDSVSHVNDYYEEFSFINSSKDKQKIKDNHLENLELYLKFDATLSGYTNNVLFSVDGSFSYETGEGQVGSGFYLNSQNGKLNYSIDINNYKNRTVQIWFYSTGGGSETFSSLLNNKDGEESVYSFLDIDNFEKSVYLTYSTKRSPLKSESNVWRTGVWNHLAIVQKNNIKNTVWLNGKKIINEYTYDFLYDDIDLNNGVFDYNQNYLNNNKYKNYITISDNYIGYIDEVAIWSKDKTEDDIIDLYNNGYIKDINLIENKNFYLDKKSYVEKTKDKKFNQYKKVNDEIFDNLILALDLNEKNQVVDYSNYNNQAYYSNIKSYFNGGKRYISFFDSKIKMRNINPYFHSNKNISISFWMEIISDFFTDMYIVSMYPYRSDEDVSYSVYISVEGDAKFLNFDYTDENKNIYRQRSSFSEMGIQTNKKYHVCLIKENHNIRFYINNEIKGLTENDSNEEHFEEWKLQEQMGSIIIGGTDKIDQEYTLMARYLMLNSICIWNTNISQRILARIYSKGIDNGFGKNKKALIDVNNYLDLKRGLISGWKLNEKNKSAINFNDDINLIFAFDNKYDNFEQDLKWRLGQYVKNISDDYRNYILIDCSEAYFVNKSPYFYNNLGIRLSNILKISKIANWSNPKDWIDLPENIFDDIIKFIKNRFGEGIFDSIRKKGNKVNIFIGERYLEELSQVLIRLNDYIEEQNIEYQYLIARNIFLDNRNYGDLWIDWILTSGGVFGKDYNLLISNMGINFENFVSKYRKANTLSLRAYTQKDFSIKKRDDGFLMNLSNVSNDPFNVFKNSDFGIDLGNFQTDLNGLLSCTISFWALFSGKTTVYEIDQERDFRKRCILICPNFLEILYEPCLAGRGDSREQSDKKILLYISLWSEAETKQTKTCFISVDDINYNNLCLVFEVGRVYFYLNGKKINFREGEFNLNANLQNKYNLPDASKMGNIYLGGPYFEPENNKVYVYNTYRGPSVLYYEVRGTIPFEGSFKTFCIWNRSLYEEEIEKIYSIGTNGDYDSPNLIELKVEEDKSSYKLFLEKNIFENLRINLFGFRIIDLLTDVRASSSMSSDSSQSSYSSSLSSSISSSSNSSSSLSSSSQSDSSLSSSSISSSISSSSN